MVADWAWESVQAMEGRETVMDRAATAGRAWESVQAMMGKGNP